MKRVLIVSFDFPPQGGTGTIRVAKFAKYLPQFGWHPVVVCSDAEWNRDDSLARDVPPDVSVHRVPWPSSWIRCKRSSRRRPPIPRFRRIANGRQVINQWSGHPANRTM